MGDQEVAADLCFLFNHTEISQWSLAFEPHMPEQDCGDRVWGGRAPAEVGGVLEEVMVIYGQSLFEAWRTGQASLQLYVYRTDASEEFPFPLPLRLASSFIIHYLSICFSRTE